MITRNASPDSVNKICDELEQRIRKGEGVFPKGTPRVLLSGCPMAVPNWKLPVNYRELPVL